MITEAEWYFAKMPEESLLSGDIPAETSMAV